MLLQRINQCLVGSINLRFYSIKHIKSYFYGLWLHPSICCNINLRHYCLREGIW